MDGRGCVHNQSLVTKSGFGPWVIVCGSLIYVILALKCATAFLIDSSPQKARWHKASMSKRTFLSSSKTARWCRQGATSGSEYGPCARWWRTYVVVVGTIVNGGTMGGFGREHPKPDLPGFKSQLCHLLCVWPWASYLIFLCLGLPSSTEWDWQQYLFRRVVGPWYPWSV